MIPPCGIYCGGCPNYVRVKIRCLGAADGCVNKRRCKTIYGCCVEKKELQFCGQCSTYPCSRFRKFADRWMKYGQDLYQNQQILKEKGERGLMKYYISK